MKNLIVCFSALLMVIGCEYKSTPLTKGELHESVSFDSSNYLTIERLTMDVEVHKKNNRLIDENAFFPDEFYDEYDTVQIEGEVFFIVEGDLFYDLDQLLEYKKLTNDTLSNKLVINELNGSLIKWPQDKIIKYAIIRSSFSSQTRYEQIRSNMKKAIENWSKVCNVSFQHLTSLDDALLPSHTHENLDFVVRQYDSGGKYIAKAFFPNYPKYRRKIFIDPSYYSAPFDRIGILRHELGHVLGFRHEHIRSGAPASCPKENTIDTRNLTQYDPKSVMHYFCGNEGTRDLEITKIDSIGAVLVYGPVRSPI